MHAFMIKIFRLDSDHKRLHYSCYRHIYAHYLMGELQHWTYNDKNKSYFLILKTQQEQKLLTTAIAYNEALNVFHLKTGLIHQDFTIDTLHYNEQHNHVAIHDFHYSRSIGKHHQMIDGLTLSSSLINTFCAVNPDEFNEEIIKEENQEISAIDTLFFIAADNYWKALEYISIVFFDAIDLFFDGNIGIIPSSILNFLKNINKLTKINTLLIFFQILLYLPINKLFALYDEKSDDPKWAFLISMLIISLCFLYLATTSYSVWQLLFFTSQLLAALSLQKTLYLIEPIIIIAQLCLHQYEMLKTCYSLGEEIYGSFIAPVSFWHKQLSSFHAKMDLQQFKQLIEKETQSLKEEKDSKSNPQIIVVTLKKSRKEFKLLNFSSMNKNKQKSVRSKNQLSST